MSPSLRNTCRAPCRSSAEPRRYGGLALLVALSACSPSVEHYHTRGMVKARDGAGADTRVAIHHERIEGFKDREGKRAPMPSMPMIFALAPALESTQLAAGDKLAFDFEVRWTGSPTLRITKLQKLPASTALTLTEH